MLSDQKARDDFTYNTHTNFSVIASPGTGKTTAITDRISNIICSCKRPNDLKNFLAVTYTEKAAKEIKERVYKNITAKVGKNLVSKIVFSNFNNIFFGTIHSLCAQFLRNHGKKILIQENFKIIEDDSEIWQKFITTRSIFSEILPKFTLYKTILHHFSIDQILDEARIIKNPKSSNIVLSNPSLQNISNLLNYKPSIRETKIKNFQEDLNIWLKSGMNCNFPSFPQTSSKAFSEFLTTNIHEYILWREKTEQYLTNECAKQYQKFKIENNVLTYDDLIALTLNILNDRSYREKYIDNYQIILDEAQDTDIEQFKILLHLADKNYCNIIFENSSKKISEHASFSMVGDPKQAIYSDRADVNFYMFIHKKMVEYKLIQSLNFNITMRCAEKIVSFTNKTFSEIFLSQKILFKQMQARPEADQGKVVFIKASNNFETLYEILKKDSSLYSDTKHFSDIAILAPRKAWLREIVNFLKKNSNVPTLQLWTNESLVNEPSLIKWVASILHFILYPTDKRELAGILREIFGIKTNQIIDFICHNKRNICTEITNQISNLRQELNNLLMPNFIREIINQFQLLSRINILNLYPQEEIIKHSDWIMNAAYIADANDFSYEALEKDLIQLYANPPIDNIINKEALQLLTFHKSKGLEWPIVILPFMYREHKILNDSSSNVKNLDNEARLLFVACTRAKNQLIFLDDSENSKISNKVNMISSGKLINSIKNDTM